MFCSQCGKRVKETMRFCPFCGSAIELPDQEESAKIELNKKREVPKAFSEQLQKDDSGVFIPLSMDDSMWKVPEPKAEAKLTERAKPVKSEEAPAPKAAGEKEAPAPQRSRRPTADDERPTQTYTPQRRFDPNDIFFDAHHDDEDEDDEEISFEDEDSGFLARHTRGLVALIMILVLIVACACYLYTDAGQKLLTRFDLAWKPQAYAAAAYEDYSAQRYDRAAAEYVQALSRDPQNYEYARSAGIMFYHAGDLNQAETMARRAIELDPQRQDGYDLIRLIYPEEEARGDEIRSLLQGH